MVDRVDQNWPTTKFPIDLTRFNPTAPSPFEYGLQAITTGFTTPNLSGTYDNLFYEGFRNNTLVRFALTGDVVLTGMIPVQAGEIKRLVNSSLYVITLNDNDLNSAEGYRFALGGFNRQLQPGTYYDLWYDAISNVWRGRMVDNTGGGVPFDPTASYNLTGIWTFLNVGNATDPGIAVGQTTSGITQIGGANTLSFVNEFQGTAPLQNHGNISIADNSSLVIGSPTGLLSRNNHPAIEINHLGKKLSGLGASVPLQVNTYESDVPAIEPWISYRSRATTIGGIGAVLPSDVLLLIQAQGDDGLGATNPVAGNIGLRVKAGSVIGADIIPGEFYVSTADALGNVDTRIKVSEDGITIQTGDLMFGGSQVVAIDENINARFASLGYLSTVGGSVIQATNKATGVTLDTPCGKITMNNAPLAAGAVVTFIMTNSLIAINDILTMNHGGGGNTGNYAFTARCATGQVTIGVRNLDTASHSDAVIIVFGLIKGDA